MWSSISQSTLIFRRGPMRCVALVTRSRACASPRRERLLRVPQAHDRRASTVCGRATSLGQLDDLQRPSSRRGRGRHQRSDHGGASVARLRALAWHAPDGTIPEQESNHQMLGTRNVYALEAATHALTARGLRRTRSYWHLRSRVKHALRRLLPEAMGGHPPIAPLCTE